MAASSPSPPVPFKDQCAIVWNNTLYVYQPDAFQTLQLTQGAKWQQETNGVAVTGAACVKGGVDGDSEKPALYVVGGTTNSSTTTYSGVQRYSILDKTWTTIAPLVSVTAQRQFHGATYLNASSAILVYGGSQNGDAGPSTETFLMLMYPPYGVQSYPSTAPPVVNPLLMPWSDDEAVMVGGGSTNQKVFKFHPDPGWYDLGLALPEPIPDKSIAQSSLVTLADNSKILFTYDMSQSPNVVRANVLLNPGGLPAVYDEPVGTSTSGAASPSATSSRMVKRDVFFSNYPAYNSSSASTVTRTNFALAQGENDLTAFVGGDSGDTVQFYDKLANTWVSPTVLLGAQQPLVSSTSTTAPSSTASSTHSASASSTPAAVSHSNSSNGLAILGGVLGGICGLAAILIILLLWLRQVRRKQRADQAQKNASYPEGKTDFEEQGLQPLARQAQPMGRSPVPSAVLEDRDSVAMFGARNEKAFEAGAPAKNQLGIHSNGSGIGFGFKREKSPLNISKPMMPDLGDYQVRPSIELGKATPITPTVAVDTGLMTALPDPVENIKADQRKTDEGWAKYFSPEKENDKRDTTITLGTSATNNSVPSRSGRGGFWPGSGVPEAPARSPKNPLRDSEGRSLTAQKVMAASPNLTSGATDMRMHTMSTAEGMEAKISSGDSISTDVTDDEDYEDEKMTVYSSGVPESVHDTTWTPVGNTWSGPAQRAVRPPSVQVGAHDFPPPTNMSNGTQNTDSTKSSLPTFPMPGSTVRQIQPSGGPPPIGLSLMPGSHNSTASSIYGPGPGARASAQDYFGAAVHHATTVTPAVEAPTHRRAPSQPAAGPSASTDMSWVNLGTPAGGPPPARRQSHGPANPHVPDT